MLGSSNRSPCRVRAAGSSDRAAVLVNSATRQSLRAATGPWLESFQEAAGSKSGSHDLKLGQLLLCPSAAGMVQQIDQGDPPGAACFLPSRLRVSLEHE